VDGVGRVDGAPELRIFLFCGENHRDDHIGGEVRSGNASSSTGGDDYRRATSNRCISATDFNCPVAQRSFKSAGSITVACFPSG